MVGLFVFKLEDSREWHLQFSMAGPMFSFCCSILLTRKSVKKEKYSILTVDTRHRNLVNSKEEAYRLKEDIEKLLMWADKWHVKFNAENYEVMHFGE